MDDAGDIAAEIHAQLGEGNSVRVGGEDCVAVSIETLRSWRDRLRILEEVTHP